MNKSDLCPCNSNLTFADCCEQIVAGSKQAATPLQLMRSRYTAHVCKNMPHILRTMTGKPLKMFDEQKTNDEWFEQCVWTKLEIINAPEVAAVDKTGTVEFKAHYEFAGKKQELHELSKFQKIDGKWLYVARQNKGAHIETSNKIGRNDICSCGSGKKFKKCCAA